MTVKSALITALGVSVACVGFADTIAWYHFDELEPGTRTTAAEPTILNAVDNSLFSATPRTQNGATQGDGVAPTFGTTAAQMPLYSTGFGEGRHWNDPVTHASGENTRALYFQSSSKDAYNTSSIVTVDDDERLHLQTFTVELFCKTAHTEVYTKCWEDLIIRNRIWKNAENTWAVRLSGNQLSCRVTSAKGTVYNLTSSAVGLMDGKWHHVAVTMNQATHEFKMYVDYVMVKSETLDDDLDYGSAEQPVPLQIGGDTFAGYGNFYGWIDEVRISNAALEPKDFLRPGTTTDGDDSAVDADTAVYVSFNELTWFGKALINHALWNPAVTAPVVTLRGSGIQEVVEDVLPGSQIRGGILSEGSSGNLAALHFKTNAEAMKSGYLEVADHPRKITLGSFTIEGFFRWTQPPGGKERDINHYIFAQHATNGQYFVVAMASNGKITVNLRDVATGAVSGMGTTAKGYVDDKWHHVALVVNRDERSAAFYVDYAAVLSKQNIVLDADSGYSSAYPDLYIDNGYSTAAYQMNEGYLDEVRITKRALAPHEFLTTYPKYAGRDLFWASFEDDSADAEPYPLLNQGVLSKFVSTGAVPTISNDPRWGRNGILTGDATGTRANTRCLYVNGGQVNWGRDVLLENLEELTAEVTLRLESADTYAGLLRMSATYGVGSPVWALSVESGHPMVRVDTDRAVNQSHVFSGLDLLDGRWHSLALTFVKSGDNTVVTLYRNRTKVDSYVVSGHLATNLTVSNFSLGASSVSTAKVVGCFDEVRVTGRALEPDEMIMRVPVGLYMLIR